MVDRSSILTVEMFFQIYIASNSHLHKMSHHTFAGFSHLTTQGPGSKLWMSNQQWCQLALQRTLLSNQIRWYDECTAYKGYYQFLQKTWIQAVMHLVFTHQGFWFKYSIHFWWLCMDCSCTYALRTSAIIFILVSFSLDLRNCTCVSLSRSLNPYTQIILTGF